jgi:hypothetical protein
VTERPQPDRERLSSFAGGDDVRDSPHDSIQGVDEWNSLQAYLIGEVGVHLHFFGLRTPDDERCDGCAVMKRAPLSGAEEFDAGVVMADPREIDKARDGDEFSVLVTIGEAVEDGERVPSGIEPGQFLARLERLRVVDDCPYWFWHAPDHWSTVHLKFAGVVKIGNCFPLAA